VKVQAQRLAAVQKEEGGEVLVEDRRGVGRTPLQQGVQLRREGADERRIEADGV
jgi:hypothetical protein